MELARQVVDAVNALYGSHDGARALHAKGTLLRGAFTATPAGGELTRAQHMRGQELQATVRFSNAGGDPQEEDFERVGRGMAVKLYLEDGATTDFVTTNTPTFIARTPQDFLELMIARRPNPETGQPDMERLGAYLGQHPEAGAAIQAALGTEPPASFAQMRFNGLHAYRWIAPDGTERWVRWWWQPDAGVETLPDDQARELGPDYLQRDIAERAEAGASFTLVVQLGEEGDPTDDSTAAWPDERETVEAGKLLLTGRETEREQGDDILVFDPTRVPDGIELSDDPILTFRRDAYSESVLRRSGVARA